MKKGANGIDDIMWGRAHTERREPDSEPRGTLTFRALVMKEQQPENEIEGKKWPKRLKKVSESMLLWELRWKPGKKEKCQEEGIGCHWLS